MPEKVIVVDVVDTGWRARYKEDVDLRLPKGATRYVSVRDSRSEAVEALISLNPSITEGHKICIVTQSIH